jgi:hypothetical protein
MPYKRRCLTSGDALQAAMPYKRRCLPSIDKRWRECPERKRETTGRDSLCDIVRRGVVPSIDNAHRKQESETGCAVEWFDGIPSIGKVERSYDGSQERTQDDP